MPTTQGAISSRSKLPRPVADANFVSDLRDLYGRLPSLLRNKYVLTLAAFVVYVSFFDHYSLYKQWELRRTLRGLQAEKVEYARTIEESEELRRTIQADEERFARERYFMKRANEDVYVFD